MPVTTDILIVGAGPVGLYGAYCAGFRGLRTAVVDALPTCGGQITALYPEKEIRDVAAVPSAKGREMVDALKAQADTFDPHYLLGRQAVSLSRTEDGRPQVALSDGTVVEAGAVVLTAGIGTFTPRTLPAGEELLGRGLSYFVPSLEEYRDRDVVVVGGGDSAVDWALALQPVARSVVLVHRRSAFRAHAASVQEVYRSGIDIVTDAQVSALYGEAWLSEVHLKVDGEDEVRVHKADACVAALGFISNLGPLAEWGIELDRRTIVVDTRMRTNLDGVYAAGDITSYVGKVRLMSVGFGEVATAVNNAAVALDPSLQLFPGHSTDAT
ncbi:NAD(P)/FAD-dependent oxidoreductase [Nocardioides sp. cx-169]|uniref:NAD(P)/FAD-dependent oxidoreductase n=1 Tax=Nocardioides sp. cx-169 TaxID=2899080 RepID=UPI001E4450AB|nr:NAD(P)/FAD-dependent oxidoreductase [Nocardioides sp. cx-169]MCD4533065.1 NAD(P)/FAD-dependent oxidoreductase [Nocardioides sp. cx-169]